jgi:hypothetical protein
MDSNSLACRSRPNQQLTSSGSHELSEVHGEFSAYLFFVEYLGKAHPKKYAVRLTAFTVKLLAWMSWMSVKEGKLNPGVEE